MYLIKTISFLLFLLALSTWTSAQDPYHINYSAIDGLPSAEVYDMAIGADGKLWFTTDRGVCTFDGYDFATYSTQDGLSNNTNFEIVTDPQGRFWFTAMDGGLSYFEGGKFHTFQHNEKLKSITKGRWITDFLWEGNELVFSMKHNIKEYHIINMETGNISPKHEMMLPENLHSAGPLGKSYAKNFGKQVLFYNEQLKFGENIVQLKRNSGTLAAPSGQPISIRKNSVELIKLPQPTITDFIYEDRIGHIWFGTQHGLLLFKSGRLDQQPEVYFKDLSITCIMMDEENNYWVSSIEQGVFFIPSFFIRQISFDPAAPSVEKILSIGKLPRHLLFGTSGGRLFILNKNMEDKEVKLLHHKSQIQKIYTKGNHAFVEEFRFAEETDNKISTVSHTDFAMSNFPMKNGLILHSSPTGYYIVSDNKSIFSTKDGHSTIANKRIMAIAEDENQQLLLGTMEGLYKLDPDRYEEVIDITSISPLLKTRISDIHPLPNMQCWLASIGNGLLFKNQDTVLQVTEEDGLISNLINKIALQGDSIIWIASNKGLNKLHYRMFNQLPLVTAIEGYTTTDGLMSNFVNDISIWNGHLWLALNNGINYVKPEQLKKRMTPPRIYLESVSVIKNQKIISPDEALPSDQNDIVFNFKGICFSKPESNYFYRYKLKVDKSESEWYYTNDRTARFTNLSPGDYQFTVTARNNNDIWAETATPFSFTIKPHFSETLWFRFLAFLLVAVLISLFMMVRNRQLRQDKKLQEALYLTKDAELSALRSQMNPHFVFNSLNAIQNYIFKNDIEKANYYLSRFSRLIRSSLELSKLEYISLLEEVDFIRNYMELELMRFPNKFEFQIEIDDELSEGNYFIPPLLLQPVLENSVKYAFKHTDYKGLIKLEIIIDETSNLMQVVIEDNGSGMKPNNPLGENKPDKKHRSYGLEIIKDRIKLLNESKILSKASFKYGNRKGKNGLRTEFIIPIRVTRID